MNSLVLDHLYDGDRDLLLIDILAAYQKHGSLIINFLYFSNAMHYRLMERHRNAKDLSYKQALLASDFLLADGIALQFYKWFSDLERVENLNGTDLTPWLLDRLTQDHSVSLYVYSTYDESINKDATRLAKGLDTLLRDFPALRIASSYQSHYAERGVDFPFEQFECAVAKDDAAIKLFLNSTGTPFQEVRVEAHREWFVKHGFLVMNVGGFLDFLSGFETRAPEWMVKARVLETPYRMFSHPAKNIQKFIRMFGILRILKSQLVNSLRCFFRKK